uniref:DDE_3 domain-containing protein n=1 Tax=Strongyloides venezuelensis TaxID=75913 RepID=A0A0K0FS62_STRVS
MTKRPRLHKSHKAARLEYAHHPSRSPDLNLIENLWEILVCAVNKNIRQYSTVQELKEAIAKCWDEILSENLFHL